MEYSSNRILIDRFLQDRLNLDPEWIKNVRFMERHGVTYAYLDSIDHDSPNLITFTPGINNGYSELTAYHRIRNWANRQIVSYILGRDLVNLAEVKEIERRLYSRSCLCHQTTELPHHGPEQSKIGLWIHDCLTEDMDHNKNLNRRTLPDGTCLSFDFGLAFSCRYYSPFYSFELGISDMDIRQNQDFIVNVLSEYATRALTDEETLINEIKRAYPQTIRESKCRFYRRNFKAWFAKRIHKGAFFKKLDFESFNQRDLIKIAAAVGVRLHGISCGRSFSDQLAIVKPPVIDLRGLDLSGADLRRTRLCGADLREADLTGCILSEADLRCADFRGARTKGADFNRAKLEGATF